ncbi:MAG: hypothetical protein ACYCO3_04795, partial [Mycobacteriales bacterium]
RRRRTAAGLDGLAALGTAQLGARLARPPRASGDWSIDPPSRCRCKLCGTLAEFLADPVRQRFEWPLAQDGRRHIHTEIDAFELPVRHQTRRTGRPYTLVLDKTDALFQRENQRRRRDEADRAWLTTNWLSGRASLNRRRSSR